MLMPFTWALEVGHSLVGYYTRDRRRENSSPVIQLTRWVAAGASPVPPRDAFVRGVADAAFASRATTVFRVNVPAMTTADTFSLRDKGTP